MIDRLLDGMNDFASAYIDDIIVFSGTWGDHLHHLRQVLHHIQEVALTLWRERYVSLACLNVSTSDTVSGVGDEGQHR